MTAWLRVTASIDLRNIKDGARELCLRKEVMRSSASGPDDTLSCWSLPNLLTFRGKKEASLSAVDDDWVYQLLGWPDNIAFTCRNCMI